ncbi:DUF1566 domain-containing protein [bacterium]|nr:DUF1566 domain-containing protein [bacterium]MBU1958723.1 DUF1566 domain-containing protein [bacterium]
MINKKRAYSSLLAFLFLTGCGGDGGTTENRELIKGKLVDSPVINVTYTCEKKTALTSEDGSFECLVLPISFSVGGIELGTIYKQTADSRVLPQDLAGVSRADIDNKEVLKIIVLLQSLDDDGDISTAITIPNDINFGKNRKISEMDISEVKQLLTNKGIELVLEAVAIEHLRENSGDITLPIITLNGSATVTITKDDAYVDAGATAKDDRDGVLQVVTTGSMESSTVGIYTITYTATDKAGNKTTTERTVIVKEREVVDTTVATTTLNESTLVNVTESNDTDDKEVPIIVTEIITDTTGLMWQDNSDTNTSLKTLVQAESYCKKLTIAGYNDWRLPSIEELFSIVDTDKFDTATNGKFIYTNATSYWSSNTYTSDNSLALGINFYDGSDGLSYKTTPHYTRCVRGEALVGPVMVKTKSQMVNDISNNLTWQDSEDIDKQFITYKQATEYCSNLTLQDKSEWRLPTIVELRSIVDRNRSNPAINQVFENGVNGFFWSTTLYKADNTKVWSILFTDGNDYQAIKTDKGYVRCIKEN